MSELSSLKETILKYNLIAKKSLGQNFILDQNLTDKIARNAGCNPLDTVIEIGPGPGGLTRSILKQNIKKLIVIEQDERFIEPLMELKSYYPEKLEIINTDALKIDLRDIVPSGAKIIANLPYNIATTLLFEWLDYIEYFTSLTLMFQKEVANRIIAKPRTKEYGRLSVMLQAFSDVEYIFDIPASAFTPRPKITSSVLKIKYSSNNQNISKEKLSQLCKISFNQRRKFLKSNLKPLIKDPISIFSELAINENARAEELTISQFCSLTNYLL